VDLERLQASRLGAIDHPDVVMLENVYVLGRQVVSKSLFNVVN